VQAQWRLTQFDPDSGVPTMSINVQESIPTGRFDHLSDHPSDGFGSGARTTTLGWYAQTYFWMPNGRILRTRLDIADAFSRSVNIEDVSVYGTGTGFRGRAKPGDVQTVDLAFEYSVTQNWVLALDLLYRHSENTRVTGQFLLGHLRVALVIERSCAAAGGHFARRAQEQHHCPGGRRAPLVDGENVAGCDSALQLRRAGPTPPEQWVHRQSKLDHLIGRFSEVRGRNPSDTENDVLERLVTKRPRLSCESKLPPLSK
jgi:hypothetical protein